MLPALAGQGRILIASCGEDEVSLEAPDLAHGLFTYYLLRGLEGGGDLDGDGRVGVAELFEHVSTEVSRTAQERFGLSQNPWKNDTGTGGVYLTSRQPGGPAEVGPGAAGLRALLRTKGSAAALAEAERLADSLGEGELIDVLRLVREKEEPAATPLVFHLLAHEKDGVRRRANSALQAIGWPKAAAAAWSRPALPTRNAKDGCWTAYTLGRPAPTASRCWTASPTSSKGTCNRAIKLHGRKRLALGLEETAALFRQHQIPYRLIRVLGQGLHTAAYLARDDDSDLDLVVGVLLPEYAAQPEVRAEFLDLGKQAARLGDIRIWF